MKIKIVNKTSYYTPDLRAFLRAGYKAVGADKHRHRVVEFVYRRRHQLPTGRASLGEVGFREANYMKLWLPKDGLGESWDMYRLGRLFEHEVMHNFGYRHKDMSATLYVSSDESYKPKWVEGLTLRKKSDILATRLGTITTPTREERRASIVNKRAEHARAMYEKHQRALEREKKLVLKWGKKVKYYEEKATCPIKN